MTKIYNRTWQPIPKVSINVLVNTSASSDVQRGKDECTQLGLTEQLDNDLRVFDPFLNSEFLYLS